MRALRDRVVVVTGAAAGIGRGLAEAFAERGARLVLADLDAEALETTRRGLATAEASVCVATDVTDPDSVEALAIRAFSIGGDVAVVCNNAGVAAGGVVWEQSLEDWNWMFAANVMGIVHGLRSFVPRLLAQDAPAHIVNTASMMGLLTAPGLGAYGASKHAALAISETLRHDLAARGASIGVSVLCPGPVATRIHEERTRPPEARRAAATDAEQLAQRAQIRALMEASISARTVADRVVDAVIEDRFFVFSHPDQLAGLEARAAEIQRSHA
ncbi:MAG: SDR family NAD(P)-dependent oxidoreductase [Myxococcota bacterium]